jgi:hypothetical protein
MSARRWGIGLVTGVVAVLVALSSVMATIVLLYSLCEPSQHAPGSTADDLCSTAPGAVAFIAYLVIPTLAVVVAGIAGIKTQRWRSLWLGLAVALGVLIVVGLVMGNVSTTA